MVVQHLLRARFLRRLIALSAVAVFAAGPVAAAQDVPAKDNSRRAREEAAYPVTTFEMPADVHLEIGGLAVVRGSGRAARVVCVTRRGEVWGIDGFAEKEPQAAASISLLAEGLHEPLGLLLEKDGSLLTACRGELMRLVDEDGDGNFETQLTVGGGWPLSGNYHEYNFGPAPGGDGSYWITTNKPFGAQPFGEADWRGYAMRILPNGEVKPMCAGLRSPAGVETSPWGEVFYTDNQGEWCGASKLSLLTPGSYHGHPHGLPSTEEPAWTFPKPKALPDGQYYSTLAASGDYPTLQMPSVWFPYDKMGRSPAGFVWDQTKGKFGPFAGQIFVADQYEAAVFRVDLERVRGHWQGACFRFREGLACGVIRLAWTPDGALLLGETDRGWGSKGPLTEGLERLDFSGKAPFEIHTMRLLPGGAGFALRFTAPADPETFDSLDGLDVLSYTYSATERYGSPEQDNQTVQITGHSPHEDGLGVDILVPSLREGYVHEITFAGIQAKADSLGLLHPAAYYTLQRLKK